jgi:hypothetical protein
MLRWSRSGKNFRKSCRNRNKGGQATLPHDRLNLDVDFGFLCDLCGSSSANSAVKGFCDRRGNQKLFTAENTEKGRRVRKEKRIL